MGIIENAVRKNKQNEARHEAERLRIASENEAMRIAEEAKAERAKQVLVNDMLDGLAPIVLASLAERNYPQGELGKQFVKKSLHPFRIKWWRIAIRDHSEYAYWVIREGHGSQRQLVLRSDGARFVRIMKRYFTVKNEAPVYAALRSFALFTALVDERIIVAHEQKFEIENELLRPLGIIRGSLSLVQRAS